MIESISFKAVFSLLAVSVLSMIAPAFGQEEDPQDNQLQPRAQLNGAGESNLTLNATDSALPMVEKLSDNGLYLVQLRWPEVPLNPNNAFDIQLFFLDASSPTATFPQAESNFTGSGTDPALTVPDTVASLLPIESYDITIYSDTGAILWQETNQPGAGGRPGQHIQLADDYIGPATIEITNIRAGGQTGSTVTSLDLVDSVSFEVSIVPEFASASVILAAGFAGGIAGIRWITSKRGGSA